MEGYRAATYGESIAEQYDQIYLEVDPQMIDVLTDLAGTGPALELAIGTGRVALPLARRGVTVHGIDISEAMLAQLRAKPGGKDISVTMGNFADVAVAGTYPLIFVVFNTFFALLTQEEQVACFRNAADHLDAGGRFLIEAFVPDLARFDRGQRMDAMSVELESIRFNVSRHHPASQRVDSQHVVLDGTGTRMFPISIRYAWPAEMDLMAALAGLELEARWAGWDRSEFGDDSQRHVSVYRRG